MMFVSEPDLLQLAQLQEEIVKNTLFTKSVERYVRGKLNAFSVTDIFYLAYFPDGGDGRSPEQRQYFSRYEHPTNVRMLSELNTRFWKMIEKTRFDTTQAQFRRNVTLGTLPLGVANALTTKTAEGNYLIAINDGVFSLVRGLVELFVKTLVDSGEQLSIPSEETVGHFLADPEINSLFTEMMSDYFVLGSAENTGSEELVMSKDAQRFNISRAIVHSFMIFLVAHEYNHVFLGHLDHEEDEPEEEEKARDAAWGQELSCDLNAAAMCCFYDAEFMSLGVSLASLGIELFCILDEISNELVQKDRYTSHPPPQIRRSVTLGKIGQLAGSNDQRVTELVWEDLRRLIVGLWEKNKSQVAQALSSAEHSRDRNERRGRALLDAAIGTLKGGPVRDKPRVILY